MSLEFGPRRGFLLAGLSAAAASSASAQSGRNAAGDYAFLPSYARAQQWLDGELADRSFLAGEAFSMADICALSTVDFAAWIGLALDPERKNVAAWHARVTSRPSAAA